MKRWAAWILSLLLVAGFVFASPYGTATGPNVFGAWLPLSGGTETGTVNSSVASGSNAFALLISGARVDFGAGASDYASSDGTTVTFAGPLAATSTAGTSAFTITLGTYISLDPTNNNSFIRAPSGSTIELSTGIFQPATNGGTALGATGTRWGAVFSTSTYASSVASGSNAFQVDTSGARVDFGAGASDYASSDGTTVTFAGPFALVDAFTCRAANCVINWGNAGTQYLTATAAGPTEFAFTSADVTFTSSALVLTTTTENYVGSAITIDGASTFTSSALLGSPTPHTMFVTYVNNTIAALTYGGGIAPAFNFDVSAVRFTIRTAGSGGTTNATIRISDGTTNCDCAFACNTAAGNQRVACSSAANCDFEASDSMTVSVSGVGDCTVTTDILGNLEFETIWEN